jgi:phosphoenolpyruvate carboxylase
MYRDWPPSTDAVNMDMVLAKTDVSTPPRYATLVDDTALRQTVFRIDEEFREDAAGAAQHHRPARALEHNPRLPEHSRSAALPRPAQPSAGRALHRHREAARTSACAARCT